MNRDRAESDGAITTSHRLMRLPTALMIITLLMMAMPTSAAQEAFQKLRSTFKAINSIEADFKQTNVNEKGEVTEVLQGSMKVKRPKKFLWIVASPYPQHIVTNGETVWLFDSDLDQVTLRPLGRSLSRTPAVMLSDGVDQANRHFDVTYKEDQETLEFTLQAKAQNAHFKRFTFLFKSGILQQLTLFDRLQQKSEIVFTHVKQNSVLSDDLFEFQIPEGVDVITNQN